MKKRFLSVVVIWAMCLALTPASSFANGEPDPLLRAKGFFADRLANVSIDPGSGDDQADVLAEYYQAFLASEGEASEPWVSLAAGGANLAVPFVTDKILDISTDNSAGTKIWRYVQMLWIDRYDVYIEGNAPFNNDLTAAKAAFVALNETYDTTGLDLPASFAMFRPFADELSEIYEDHFYPILSAPGLIYKTDSAAVDIDDIILDSNGKKLAAIRALARYSAANLAGPLFADNAAHLDATWSDAFSDLNKKATAVLMGYVLTGAISETAFYDGIRATMNAQAATLFLPRRTAIMSADEETSTLATYALLKDIADLVLTQGYAGDVKDALADLDWSSDLLFDNLNYALDTLDPDCRMRSVQLDLTLETFLDLYVDNAIFTGTTVYGDKRYDYRAHSDRFLDANQDPFSYGFLDVTLPVIIGDSKIAYDVDTWLNDGRLVFYAKDGADSSKAIPFTLAFYRLGDVDPENANPRVETFIEAFDLDYKPASLLKATLTPSYPTIAKGDTRDFTVTISNKAGGVTIKGIDWVISDNSYAGIRTVTTDGSTVTVKGLAKTTLDTEPTITATITYKDSENYTHTITLSTRIKVTEKSAAKTPSSGGGSKSSVTPYYTVASQPTLGGSVSPSASAVFGGGSVTVSVAPEAGYRVAAVFVNGEPISVPEALLKGETDTFLLSSIYEDSEIRVVFMPQLKIDDASHMAYMKGYPDGSFGPERGMTRAEVVVMFSRLLAAKMDIDQFYASKFTDIPADAWYANSIGYMENFSVISGYADGTFRPDAPITRAEFATIASKFDILTSGGKTFSDIPADYWAFKHIAFAAEKGWVSGYEDGSFRPDNDIVRCEVVSVANRMLNRAATEAGIAGKAYRTFTDVDKSQWFFYDVTEATTDHTFVRQDGAEIWN